ncbi:MAG: septal ring lytic transglycosylase RlpA family protein [Sulfurovaceae bacterium]|nr:septal ring lytic transglycosylase RlpA family protein [Sulfurovaceae bacterium]
MSRLGLQIFSICLIVTGMFAETNDVNVTKSAQDTNVANTENNESVKYVCYASGKCSWYGSRFDSSRTASGEKFDSSKKTAAHPRLPFGTLLKVTDIKTNKSVIVRVNDRGPFVKSRVLDISYAAAKELDVVGNGVFNAKIELAQ